VLRLKKSEDILDKINDKCMLISYIKAEIGDPHDADIKITTSILCGKDKQEYLGEVRKWQENYEEEIEKKATLRRSPEYAAAVEGAWVDFWSDLEPDKNKNQLKEIPKLGIQFIDQEGYFGTSSLSFKGELEELKNNEGCILVDYTYVDFGEEVQHDYDGSFDTPCATKNYIIKNKVAILCNGDKKEYLKRVGKWHQKYLSEYSYDKVHLREYEVNEWINDIWNNLDPNKNLKEHIPFINVHNWDLESSYNPNSLKIEVIGEINHRWDYPDFR